MVGLNMETSWHTFPKVWNIGHAAARELFDGPVVVQEKVDGSQISFGVFGGELKVRSKGKELVLDAPEKMFSVAVQQIKSFQHLLKDGWTYRGDYLSKPKHNALAYDRVPPHNIIIFDISPSQEEYLPAETVRTVAEYTDGLMVVPTF